MEGGYIRWADGRQQKASNIAFAAQLGIDKLNQENGFSHVVVRCGRWVSVGRVFSPGGSPGFAESARIWGGGVGEAPIGVWRGFAA